MAKIADSTLKSGGTYLEVSFLLFRLKATILTQKYFHKFRACPCVLSF
ncbi:hypothetical protein [Helicobacter cinaedi]|nr:hypothetical protein [Helicobacter cinaedi]